MITKTPHQIKKVWLLKNLLNNATPSFPHFTKFYSLAEAQSLWDANDIKYFHKVEGRELRVNLNGNKCDLTNYININGSQIITIINQ